MLSVLQPVYRQVPLIQVIHEDDIVLLRAPDAAWFEALYCFRWKYYRIDGARYYDALYELNKREAEKRQERISEREDLIKETEEEGKQRLLFARVTMQKHKGEQTTNTSIIYEGEVPESKLLNSDPSFVRVCGFAPKHEQDEHCLQHVPGLQKLEQFD